MATRAGPGVLPKRPLLAERPKLYQKPTQSGNSGGTAQAVSKPPKPPTKDKPPRSLISDRQALFEAGPKPTEGPSSNKTAKIFKSNQEARAIFDKNQHHNNQPSGSSMSLPQAGSNNKSEPNVTKSFATWNNQGAVSVNRIINKTEEQQQQSGVGEERATAQNKPPVALPSRPKPPPPRKTDTLKTRFKHHLAVCQKSNADDDGESQQSGDQIVTKRTSPEAEHFDNTTDTKIASTSESKPCDIVVETEKKDTLSSPILSQTDSQQPSAQQTAQNLAAEGATTSTGQAEAPPSSQPPFSNLKKKKSFANREVPPVPKLPPDCKPFSQSRPLPPAPLEEDQERENGEQKNFVSKALPPLPIKKTGAGSSGDSSGSEEAEGEKEARDSGNGTLDMDRDAAADLIGIYYDDTAEPSAVDNRKGVIIPSGSSAKSLEQVKGRACHPQGVRRSNSNPERKSADLEYMYVDTTPTHKDDNWIQNLDKDSGGSDDEDYEPVEEAVPPHQRPPAPLPVETKNLDGGLDIPESDSYITPLEREHLASEPPPSNPGVYIYTEQPIISPRSTNARPIPAARREQSIEALPPRQPRQPQTDRLTNIPDWMPENTSRDFFSKPLPPPPTADNDDQLEAGDSEPAPPPPPKSRQLAAKPSEGRPPPQLPWERKPAPPPPPSPEPEDGPFYEDANIKYPSASKTTAPEQDLSDTEDIEDPCGDYIEPVGPSQKPGTRPKPSLPEKKRPNVPERSKPSEPEQPAPPQWEREPAPPQREREPALRPREREPAPPPREQEPVPQPREREPVPPQREREPAPPPRERVPAPPPREQEPVPRPREREPVPPQREQEPAPLPPPSPPVPTTSGNDELLYEDADMKDQPSNGAHGSNPSAGQYLPVKDVDTNEDSNSDSEQAPTRKVSHKFDDEPLYQYYHADVVVREFKKQRLSTSEDEDDLLYEDADTVREFANTLRRNQSLHSTASSDHEPSRQSVHTECDLLTEALQNLAGIRRLWREMPEVLDSGYLQTMTDKEMKLQESLFEILTSEASYLKSLNLLVTHFMMEGELNKDAFHLCILNRHEHKNLFSNVADVRDVSKRLMEKLKKRWMQNFLLDPETITKLISSFASKYFDVYVKYVGNQAYQERQLNELMQKNELFTGVLARLERNQRCQGLTMRSFLMLPMQRVTRMPLLIEAVAHRMEISDPGYAEVQECLSTLQGVAKRCNAKVRQFEHIEELNELNSKLHFKNMRQLPLISEHRSLVKKGDLVNISTKQASLFRKRSDTLTLILFNDLLLITKKRGERFEVLEHTPRISIDAQLVSQEQLPQLLHGGAPAAAKNVFMLVLLREDKNVEYLLACSSASERVRWTEALHPPEQSNEDEKIYEEWDCPQVQAVVRYEATQPDELSLEVSDVIKVYKKMQDGWYQGERIRDGERGWFHSVFTEEIQSAHTRCKNRRLQYRLLQQAHDSLRNKMSK